MQATNGFSIGHVARRAGLRPSAIRYYEACGLLPEPARVSGWRRYGNDVFTALAAIEVAQQAGFSLAEIRTLLRGIGPAAEPSARWASLARKKLADVDALIARARTMKRLLLRGIECGCVEIDACPIVAERRSAMLGSRRRERMKGGLPLHSVAVR